MAKRYFWLKLKEDFFNQPLIRAVERGEQGGGVVLFYLKLLTLGIRTEGRLRISDTLPYDIPGLADDTRTDPTFAQRAVTRLQELGFLTLLEDGTYFLPELPEMVGSESKEAIKKRRQRSERGHCPQNVPQSKSIEKEIEKEVEVESEGGNDNDPSRLKPMGGTLGKGVVFLTQEQDEKLLELMDIEVYNKYVEKLADFIIRKDAKVANHYQTILKWYREDCS